MGGRAEETTNAWDPNENSVAQRTAEAADRTGDIFRWHPLPPKGLSYRNKVERRKIHRPSTPAARGSTSTRSRPKPPS
jgi:hypothetical protein